MRRWIFFSLLMFSAGVSAQPAEPGAGTPATTPPPATVPEAPAPPAKPRPVEKPVTKPVEKPTPPPRPAPVAKPVEPAKPANPPKGNEAVKPTESAASTTEPVPAGATTGAGCWVLAFAMLIAGFAVGFLWRHQMSRHKLGGMTVRIGTWRGIP